MGGAAMTPQKRALVAVAAFAVVELAAIAYLVTSAIITPHSGRTVYVSKYVQSIPQPPFGAEFIGMDIQTSREQTLTGVRASLLVSGIRPDTSRVYIGAVAVSLNESQRAGLGTIEISVIPGDSADVEVSER